MDWLAANWFWVLIFALFIVMHMFGHGGHGGHRGHRADEDEGRSQKRPQVGSSESHHHH